MRFYQEFKVKAYKRKCLTAMISPNVLLSSNRKHYLVKSIVYQYKYQ